MRGPSNLKAVLTIMAVALVLPACATTARLHSASEINSVGERCGLTYGELFQDAEEKRLLFLMKPGVTAEQRACVAAWARRNGLKAVFVNMEFPAG